MAPLLKIDLKRVELILIHSLTLFFSFEGRTSLRSGRVHDIRVYTQTRSGMQMQQLNTEFHV